MADLESLLRSSRSGAMVSDDVILPNVINTCMQECLARANTERRLVAGFKLVNDCLDKRSGQVLFCILPENLWNDESHTAMFKFVMALCYSHKVKMIKVDDDQLVRKIIDRTSGGQSPGNQQSYECMLVLRPMPEGSPLLSCDQQLLLYHRKFRCVDFDNLPLVRLSEY